MTDLSPQLKISDVEVYGLTNPYLTEAQQESVSATIERVNSQLDWLAQLLGWSGPEYWFNLVSNLTQKRSLLTGTFGVYDGFVYPVVKEIRNWDNTVIVEKDDRLQVGQVFYLGDNQYELLGITESEGNYVLNFGALPEVFYQDISSNNQLKVSVKEFLPYPFVKDSPRGSADVTLLVKVDEENQTLVLTYETGIDVTLPVSNKTVFEGSRVYFNLPVELIIRDLFKPTETLKPKFDFSKNLWFVDVPIGLTTSEAELSYEGNSLQVLVSKWKFDGGWTNVNIISNFTGVWSNKGGELPFNFVFDSLGLHGSHPEKAVSLDPIETSLPFNSLLDLIYYQKASVLPSVPPLAKLNQVWWNDDTGSLSVFYGDCFNCGPWVEVEYPFAPDTDPLKPAYILPDVTEFRDTANSIEEDCTVYLVSGEGLGPSDSVLDLTGDLTGECEVYLIKREGETFWRILRIILPTVASFENNSAYIPGKIPVTIKNSNGLNPEGFQFEIKNLFTSINKPYPVVLTKDGTVGVEEWFISPPPHLKYIGDTRLYSTSGPVNGELYWDHSQPNWEERAASIFYYNRWEKVGGEWQLQGDWVNLNEGGPQTSPPSEAVNYGSINLYCDKILLQDGVTLTSDDYRVFYTFDQGVLNFKYEPITFKGISRLPFISISDSLTTSFFYDISDMVFSGSRFRLNPNPMDRSSPLRLWKTQPLVVANTDTPYQEELISNLLVADENEGPADGNWERYFIRLSPLYKREGEEWQKINLVCQDFGLWGSPTYYESMSGPAQDEKVSVYEDVVLFDKALNSREILYSESYLYSNVKYETSLDEDYENSAILPPSLGNKDGFLYSELIGYEALHNRKVSTDEGNYGDWEGEYVEAKSCQALTGSLTVDLEMGSISKEKPPVWDYSIYKIPPLNNIGSLSSKVDANHYKVGYSFFAADLSAAEDAVFDIV